MFDVSSGQMNYESNVNKSITTLHDNNFPLGLDKYDIVQYMDVVYDYKIFFLNCLLYILVTRKCLIVGQ